MGLHQSLPPHGDFPPLLISRIHWSALWNQQHHSASPDQPQAYMMASAHGGRFPFPFAPALGWPESHWGGITPAPRQTPPGAGKGVERTELSPCRPTCKAGGCESPLPTHGQGFPGQKLSLDTSLSTYQTSPGNGMRMRCTPARGGRRSPAAAQLCGTMSRLTRGARRWCVGRNRHLGLFAGRKPPGAAGCGRLWGS